MKYHVKLEPSTIYGKDVEVEADSMAEAVKWAREIYCSKEQVEVSYHPTCVEPRPEDAGEDYELFEYNHEIYGECDDCKIALFESHEKNPDNDWPWQHEAGDTRHQTYVCYPCAMKRKEVGNYCPYFKHFYRTYKTGCDKCPKDGCTQAQTAYYDKLRKTLRAALSFSKAQADEVNEFLDNSEFGLAFALLSESATPHQEYHIHMGSAKALMDQGWM